VIPGRVDGNTTIGFTVTGAACLQSPGIDCVNAAGVVTVAGTTPGSKAGDAPTFQANIGGFPISAGVGALLISIEGVGTVQAFAADSANGLHGAKAPTSLTLPPTTLRDLGFGFRFPVENARITFYVADNYYPDNSAGFTILGLQSPAVSYSSQSSRKLEQLNGPCDWQTSNLENETWHGPFGPFNYFGCTPTAASRWPNTGSEVLGSDEGYSFLNRDGELMFLFGDTIGVRLPLATPVPVVQGQTNPNTFVDYGAHDAFSLAEPFPFDPWFFQMSFRPDSPDEPNFVSPFYPDGTKVDMGGDDIPLSGIDLNGTDYIMVSTGALQGNGNRHVYSCSVLVQAGPDNTYTAGRTVSIENADLTSPGNSECRPTVQPVTTLCPTPADTTGQPQGDTICQTGHFTKTAMAPLPLAYAQQIGLTEAGVLIAGQGDYRNESIYLSYVPESAFWTGLTVSGQPATQYFIGFDTKTGLPKWTTHSEEMKAVPVVYDNPDGQTPSTDPATFYDPGSVGDMSLAYNEQLGLWMMTWDGGQAKKDPPATPLEYPNGSTHGIYFSTASAPWGPWSSPQQIFNPCLDSTHGQGYGSFIHVTGGDPNLLSPCQFMAKLVPPLPQPAAGSGPVGPIIGTHDPNDPFFGTGTSSNGIAETPETRSGDIYGPYMIPGFTWTDGRRMSVGYAMSTWNPYAVVRMESEFTIAPPVYTPPLP